MWCGSASSVGVERAGCGWLPRRRWAWRRSPGWPGGAGVGAAAGSLGLPADDLGSAAPCRRPTARRRARSQIGDVEGEDLALARAAVWYSKPPQGLVPQRVVGVEEGEQLGRGDGPGARTCAARSDRVLTGTQFAHDGVNDHADVAFHIMRVLACPDPRHGAAAARAVLRRLDTPRRDGLPRRFRSTTLRACGAGRLALEQNPSARISTALGEPSPKPSVVSP